MRYKALGEGSGILRSIETESPNVSVQESVSIESASSTSSNSIKRRGRIPNPNKIKKPGDKCLEKSTSVNYRNFKVDGILIRDKSF